MSSTRFTYRKFLIGSSALLLAGAVATPILAQPALEEIIVTARRTSENLRDIPLQVTALTLDIIKDVNMTTPRDLNSLSPGLNWQSQTGGRIGPGRLFFRGLAAGARGDTKGSIFFDGNYLATSGWDIPFQYFERIEVMPGPQSAQFGRATFGGAINYVTMDPTEETRGELFATVMTIGQREINAFYGGPLFGEKVLGSLFAAYQKYEGPKAWRNPPDILHPTGVQHQGTSTLFGAGKLIFRPNDNIEIEAHIMHTYDHDDPVIVPFPNFADKNGIFTKPNGQVVRYPVGPAFHIENVPGGFPYQTANWDEIADPRRKQESWRTPFSLSWDVSDHNVSLQYYREYEWSKAGGQDFDFASFPGIHTEGTSQTLTANSAELRITSAQDQRFRYAAGLYYLRQVTLNSSVTHFDFTCNTICEPTSPASMFNPNAQFNAATSTLAGYTGTVVRNNTPPNPTNSRNTVRDQSVFAALFFDINEQFTVSFEGRYQAELIKTENFVPNGFNAQNTFKAFVPRVTVDYKYSDQGHVYALFSIGNSPGSFNTSPFIGVAAGTTASDRFVPEEELKNYELGAKGLLLDGRVSYDFAMYHMDWSNQPQTVNFLQPNSTIVFGILSGVGTSKVDGFGLTASAAPIEGLTLTANVSYNRAGGIL